MDNPNLKKVNAEEALENAEQALIEKDTKWEADHGLTRHEHQRFLEARYNDFESNAEYARFMEIQLAKKQKKMEEEE